MTLEDTRRCGTCIHWRPKQGGVCAWSRLPSRRFKRDADAAPCEHYGHTAAAGEAQDGLAAENLRLRGWVAETVCAGMRRADTCPEERAAECGRRCKDVDAEVSRIAAPMTLASVPGMAALLEQGQGRVEYADGWMFEDAAYSLFSAEAECEQVVRRHNAVAVAVRADAFPGTEPWMSPGMKLVLVRMKDGAAYEAYTCDATEANIKAAKEGFTGKHMPRFEEETQTKKRKVESWDKIRRKR